jgi:hypothetical protein
LIASKLEKYHRLIDMQKLVNKLYMIEIRCN